MNARPLTFSLALASSLLARTALADPLLGPGENALEEALADGEIDGEDAAVLHLGGHTGSATVHGESWVSLAGYTHQLMSGRQDIGAFLLVGLALDRVATGPVHRLSDPTRLPRSVPMPSVVPAQLPPPPSPTPSPPQPSPPPVLVSADVARDCVNAALTASGLGVDDGRIDALIGRARASAWLPETRLRGMRLWQDAAHTTTVTTTDSTNLYDAVGANLVLEMRLTWRLDRLLYAGDEATLERVRLERLDARTRLATRTLEVLFTWERAVLDSRQAAAGSPEERAARLRVTEAAATLDVLTAGWFGAAGRGDGARGDPP
ncbi:MAG TPA: hypothetical protein VIF09_26805 [Polyangiaceae bacterium]|jgi:hypothetical protein